MSKLFKLNILTPDKEFYNGQAEALVVNAQDGSLGIYADHAPTVAVLPIGSIKIKNEKGQWREAFNSLGFIEVLHNEVLVFVLACGWPEDIDVVRARRALEAEKEKLRQQQSINEYKASKIALSRAMERLRVSRGNNINN